MSKASLENRPDFDAYWDEYMRFELVCFNIFYLEYIQRAILEVSDNAEVCVYECQMYYLKIDEVFRYT